MGKKISQLTNEEASALSDTDVFEGEEGGGTSFKVLFSVWKSTLKTYFDAVTTTLTNKTLTAPVITTPTIDSFTNATHTHQNSAGGGTLNSAALATSPYVMQAGTDNSNSPADATAYYFGLLFGGPMLTTTGFRRIYIPRAGTITKIYLSGGCSAGTTEQSTISFRLNDTTDTTIVSTLVIANPIIASNAALSIAVAAGDFFEIKWVTPTWVTNPTLISMMAVIYIT